jgi:thiol-disulfide isomerase/thioredoxin
MTKTPAIKASVLILLATLLSSFTVHGARPLEPYTGNNKEFSLVDLKDKKHTLSDYQGKVVLVNFWASWCPPCIYEMPELTRLKKQLSDQPFEILALNVGEKKYKVRKFAKLINFHLPVLLDTSEETFDTWGIKTLPTSFLIDTDGNIRYRVRGNPGWDTEDTIKAIEQLISEPSTKDHKTELPLELEAAK